MWNRKELKSKGKQAYKNNIGLSILAGLILTFAGGGTSVSFPLGRSDSNTSTTTTPDGSTITTPDGSAVTVSDFDLSSQETMIILLSILAVVAVITLIGILISALLLNPLRVGCRKFFIENSASPAQISKETIGMGFTSNWKHIIGSIFSTQLVVFLWSLLLIIPGFIKAYEYRMVPYVVAENPTLSGREAREMSSRMMDGNKWDAFVLDLSFIGWIILGTLTLGILNLIFVTPYKAATDAELYLWLKNRRNALAGQYPQDQYQINGQMTY